MYIAIFVIFVIVLTWISAPGLFTKHDLASVPERIKAHRAALNIISHCFLMEYWQIKKAISICKWTFLLSFLKSYLYITIIWSTFPNHSNFRNMNGYEVHYFRFCTHQCVWSCFSSVIDNCLVNIILLTNLGDQLAFELWPHLEYLNYLMIKVNYTAQKSYSSIFKISKWKSGGKHYFGSVKGPLQFYKNPKNPSNDFKFSNDTNHTINSLWMCRNEVCDLIVTLLLYIVFHSCTHIDLHSPHKRKFLRRY